jgi:hypothetical protein
MPVHLHAIPPPPPIDELGGNMIVAVNATTATAADTADAASLRREIALMAGTIITATAVDDYQEMSVESLRVIAGALRLIYNTTNGLAHQDYATALAADGHAVPAAPTGLPVGAQLRELTGITHRAAADHLTWETGAQERVA